MSGKKNIVRAIQIGYVMSVVKLVVSLGVVAILIELFAGDIVLGAWTTIALASLLVHCKDIAKKLIDIFTADKLFDSLNITVVGEDDNLEDIIDDLAAANDEKDDEDKIQ